MPHREGGEPPRLMCYSPHCHHPFSTVLALEELLTRHHRAVVRTRTPSQPKRSFHVYPMCLVMCRVPQVYCDLATLSCGLDGGPQREGCIASSHGSSAISKGYWTQRYRIQGGTVIPDIRQVLDKLKWCMVYDQRDANKGIITCRRFAAQWWKTQERVQEMMNINRLPKLAKGLYYQYSWFIRSGGGFRRHRRGD